MPTTKDVLTSFRRNVKSAPSTDSYRDRLYERLFDSPLGPKEVADVRLIDLLDWTNGVESWSPGSKRLAVSATNAAFNWAVRVGLIQVNPFASAEMPTIEPGRAWTEGEYEAAISCAVGWKFMGILAFMRFMRYTGARPGEVSDLKWPMMQTNKFVLDKHKTRKKSKRPRTIPLTSDALGVLRFLPKDREFVFETKRGVPWDRSKLSKKMDQVRDRAGLPEDCVLHGIRHLFATDFIKRGGNIAVLSKILGHASIQTTINSYIHLADDDAEMMLEALREIK